MTETLLGLWGIAALFFAIAVVYAMVGLGGGSSYAALLVVFGFSAATIPNLTLLLNLIVTTVGAYNYIRRDHLRWPLFLPFIVLSLPMAWIGGSLQVPEHWFQVLLLGSLLVVLARIYGRRHTAIRISFSPKRRIVISALAGGLLGLLSGIVGIGGGIFLVPLILVLGLGSMKQAAACGVVFIWLNSLVGLISRSQYNFVDFSNYLPLIFAVMLGGAIGSQIGSSHIDARRLEQVLGIVVVLAIALLGRELLFG